MWRLLSRGVLASLVVLDGGGERKTVILTFTPGEAGKREQYLGVFGSKNTK